MESTLSLVDLDGTHQGHSKIIIQSGEETTERALARNKLSLRCLHPSRLQSTSNSSLMMMSLEMTMKSCLSK